MRLHLTHCFRGIIRLLLPLTIYASLACKDQTEQSGGPIFYDTDDIEGIDSISHDDIREGGLNSDSYNSSDGQDGDNGLIIIPYRLDGGVKCIPVTVNGYTFDMIIDTGCSTNQISLAEAKYLYDKGAFTTDDILGQAQGQLADGSICINMVVNLKEVSIDSTLTFKNVKATVSDNLRAPLLLGNEILNRVASVTIDNEKNEIHFKRK